MSVIGKSLKGTLLPTDFLELKKTAIKQLVIQFLDIVLIFNFSHI